MSRGAQEECPWVPAGMHEPHSKSPPHLAFAPYKLILHPWRPQSTHTFSPSIVRLSFYPDLAKPASLAPASFGSCHVFLGKKRLLPLTNSPSPLILTPALKLLQISKAWAASDQQRRDTEPEAASLNKVHSFRHGHRRF